MPANRTNVVRVGCLLGLLLVVAVGGFLYTRYQTMTSCLENRTPLKSISVTIDPNQDERLIEQSRKFAFKQGFRFDTAEFAANSRDWRIRMIGPDVEVMVRSPSGPGGYEIGFYNYNCINPTTASEIDGLVDDFKSFLSEVPTALITEQK